jgi:DNA-binding NarL/FixJ family response regulator
LLVDDDTAVRRGIRGLLADELATAIVEEVASAEDALERVRSERWDLVLLDIRLSGRSGLDALPDIKAACPGLCVVVLSGLPERPYAAAALRIGAAAFVCKERAPEDLTMTIVRLLAAAGPVS